ncbi:hypothetical protein [Streptomyces sp. TP-A0874]|uniref:hypothetical protein n=1 Tax=Streptomyces sp. TP-A0874 TaxID=549819 RepID=UPI0008530D09|nr:hypothetical protein [Streptomyces sp. TP-A0874]
MSSQRNRSTEEQRPAGPRPARLAAAAALTAVEGLLLVGFGLYMLVMGLFGHPGSPTQAETGGVTLLLLGAIPLIAARGLLLLRRWSRGPAIITQIMAVPVAWTLVTSGGAVTVAGVALGAAALTVLVLLVNPRATEALGIAPRDA